MRPSLKSTKRETLPETGPTKVSNSDLDHFKPAAPSKRLDDKAAALEAEIIGLKQAFGRERYIYIFIACLLFVMAIGPYLPASLLTVLIIALLVFLIAMGKYLDFPWIVLPLERWHDLALRWVDRRVNGRNSGTEPPQTDEDN